MHKKQKKLLKYIYIKITLKLKKMKEGKVKFFNESKGFGFIVNNNNSEDVFVHATGLIDQVTQNDDVIFDIERGKKGFVAVNVKRR